MSHKVGAPPLSLSVTNPMCAVTMGGRRCCQGKLFTHHTTKDPQTNLREAVGIIVQSGDKTVCVPVQLKQCFIAQRHLEFTHMRAKVLLVQQLHAFWFWRKSGFVQMFIGAFVWVWGFSVWENNQVTATGRVGERMRFCLTCSNPVSSSAVCLRVAVRIMDREER